MMKHFGSASLAVLFAAFTGIAPDANAQSSLEPTAVTGDARMVTFEYDEDRAFRILVRPRNNTVLRFGKDEKVTFVSAGDTSNFTITVPSSRGFVEIKPKWENVTTNMMVETTKRSYHIDLQSTAEGKKWYMRVAWAYSEAALLDVTGQQLEQQMPPPTLQRGSAIAEPVDTSDLVSGINPEKLTFGYTVSGSAAFKPTQVFNDGTHTYIRMPEGLQELPALFASADESPDIVLVNYVTKPPYIVVARRLEAFTLKLGRSEVRAERKKQTSWFSSDRESN